MVCLALVLYAMHGRLSPPVAPGLFPTPSRTVKLGNRFAGQVVMVDTVILAGNSDVRDENGELVRELRGSELTGPVDPAAAAAQWAWLNQTCAPRATT